MKLQEKAKEVLKGNDAENSWTIPAQGLYPHQWLWDSCFIAIGYSHFNPERAKKEITSLLKAQWDDGFLPHIRFNPKVQKNRPQWKKWLDSLGRNTSGITQPPVVAIAVLKIYQKDKDKEFLKKVFQKIKRYHEYLAKNRKKDGLLFIIHPWESGMDNITVWDSIIEKIKGVGLEKEQRIDTEFVPEKQRVTTKQLDCFHALVDIIIKNKCDINKIQQESPFIVADVLFNCVWRRANLALSELAQEINEEPAIFENWAKETEDAMNRKMLDNGVYYDFDFKNNRLIKEKTCTSLLHLYGKITDNPDIEILNDFWANYPVSTLSKESKKFEPQRYWRGPVWININWFVIRGLEDCGLKKKAQELKKKTIELIEKSGFREYFNPNTGEGLGANNFSWTAALLIDLLD